MPDGQMATSWEVMPASEKVSPGSFRAVVVNGVGCEGTFAKEGVVDNIITPKRRRKEALVHPGCCFHSSGLALHLES